MSQVFWSIYDVAARHVTELQQFAQALLSLQWAQAVLLGLIYFELVSINRKTPREK